MIWLQVAAMWVLEMEQYNEWMTEEDYEVDEGGHKKIHKVSFTDVRNILPRLHKKIFFRIITRGNL